MRYGRLFMLGLVICWPAVSRGEVLTFGFEGNVASIYDPVGVLNFVQPGQRAIYTITFDTDAPNIHPEFGPNYAYYQGITSTASVGEYSFSTANPYMDLFRDGLASQFSAGSRIEWDSPLLPGNKGVSLLLQDGYILAHVSPPSTADGLVRFLDKRFQFTFERPGDVTYFNGIIDTIYVVPEPTIIVLLTLAGFAALRRR